MSASNRAAGGVLSLLLLTGTCAAQGVLFDWPVFGGNSVAVSAGDVNGDGVADFAIGQPGQSVSDPGGVQFYSGVDGSFLRVVFGSNLGDAFGSSIVSLGDIDADGADDLAISAQMSPSGHMAYVRAVSGATGIVLWQRDATASNVTLGVSLARLPDRDGDGVAELVVGAPLTTGTSPGSAQVWSGATGATLFTAAPASPATPLFGVRVAGAADFNGDGFADFVVSDTGDLSMPNGRVSICSGFDGAVLREIDGPAGPGFSTFGRAVAILGDVDGDNVAEVVVGSPFESISPGSSGRVRLYSGASGSLLRVYQGEPFVQNFGLAVAAFQSLDGDALPDVMISAGLFSIGCCTFSTADMRVYSSVTGAQLYSGPTHARVPEPVPDVNGDGIQDYLVSSLETFEFSAGLVLTNVPGPTATVCPPKVTSDGCTPVLTAMGAPSLTLGDDLRFVTSNVPANTLGLYAWSRNAAMTPFAGGTLCLGAPVRRFGATLASGGGAPCFGSANPTGSFTFTLSKPLMASIGLLPGDVIYVQGWFRDNGFAAPDNVGLSGSLEILVWP